MFGHRFFTAHYWASRYWPPKSGSALVANPPAGRTLAMHAESRSLALPIESRELAMQFENRILP